MSDQLRVSVQWKSASIFAGENIECMITFKNASRPNGRRSPSPGSRLRGYPPPQERWKGTLPTHQRQHTNGAIGPKPPAASAFGQANLLNQKPRSTVGSPNGAVKQPPSSEGKSNSPRDNKHRRSLSIVSIGTDGAEEIPARPLPPGTGRPNNGHARAASLQVLPRRNGLPSPRPMSVPHNERAFTLPSPLHRASTSLAEQGSGVRNTSRSTLPTSGLTGPIIHGGAKESSNQLSSFTFPHRSPSKGEPGFHFSRYPPPQSFDRAARALSPRPHGSQNGAEQLDIATRILSPASMDGTPRSSGEFYSRSNNSTETLASDYVPHENPRLMHRPAHSRQPSSLAPIKTPKPEVLMMGFGQLTGSFTLDGSLINQSPFEEVKRKGIIGGRGGGGLVRRGSTKRDSGILGSFGWGNMGESFGGLLSDNGLSSIKEAKKISGAKSIPILSTPQSILFVDLQLAPGETKSFNFRHSLPKGIPPTHRGKAMKISYNLVVGTQRATKNAQQNQVQRVEVPFKVLTGVDDRGDVLGHDLMSPHTILSNSATISSVEDSRQSKAPRSKGSASGEFDASSGEFASYVQKLLENPLHSSASVLLSPTEEEARSMAPIVQQPSTTKESIDLAILRSNKSTSTKKSANRFEISRSGERVARIMLARPAYRLGESVPVAIDFCESDVSCYALHGTLESSETIDPAIALRSKASVQRVTRRIHATQYESTISAQRVLFTPVIPASAAPDFITSGVNHEWRLRFEFVTSRPGEMEGLEEGFDDLMEEVTRDDRGSVKAAVQGLPCETFDVTVPLRVYGATAGFDENAESGEFPI